MNKKPNVKSEDKETNRSILKSNSPRQIHHSTARTKAGNGHGNGIFKRASLLEAKNLNEALTGYIRETRSDSATQSRDQFKGIIRTKSPDKQAKKVQFLDSTSTSDDNEKENQNLLQRFPDCDKAANDSEFHDLLKSVTDSNLAQIIDDKTDNLLNLLSVMPSEISPDEHLHRTNINSLSKTTSVELMFVILLTFSFFVMVLKHFRYDWLAPSMAKPQLTGSEIITLMGRNIKRVCKNVVSLERYFW